ncbi:hypothetical protein M9Y10_016521 [Tritrichomonas musculus]|uniref:Protein kinase domain-containing protein n=1 Tax=Tritrichomonas musculus TaxID=1915356 RepID=A0ABR2HWE8_9EUKA
MSNLINQQSQYLIDINDYRKEKLINKGGFGSIYLIKNFKTNQQYAAKVIQWSDENDTIQQTVEREIEILINYPHPTIVKFYGYSLSDFDGANNITIIMQLIKQGSLDDLLKNSQKSLAPSDYDNTARQKILIGIACGMMHLHQHRIIHRDLKPGNVLIDSDFHPIITDFGLSKVYEDDQRMNQSKACGTGYYMAPEIFTSRKYNAKVDVYSFGLIMYSVITDCFPYSTDEDKKLPNFQLISKIINENYRPKFNCPIKKSLRHLIERCWAADPNARPTFKDIFEKLAFSKEDSFYDFSDDEDDEEENTENKYFLDDVNLSSISEYVEDITKKVPKDTKGSNNDEDHSSTPSITAQKTSTKKPQHTIDNSLNNQNQKIIEKAEKPTSTIHTNENQKIIEEDPSKVEFSCQKSESAIGILGYLKQKNPNEFDRNYIVSLSTRDPYNLLLPNWDGSFFSGDFGQFYIEFIFKDAIDLIGFEIEGAGRNLMRGYEVFINNDKTSFITIEDDTSMRDNNITRQSFQSNAKKCQVFKLVPKGGNWDRDPKQSKFISLRKIEFFTTDHPKGLVNFWRRSQQNPHLYPIKIDSNRYSTEEVHSLDSTKLILTENKDGEFCDFTFVKGAVSVDGYRLKIKKGKYSLRGWKIVGKTINGEEKVIAEFEGGPKQQVYVSGDDEIQTKEYMKSVRIYRTRPNNDGTLYLEFFHFELFGNYIKL